MRCLRFVSTLSRAEAAAIRLSRSSDKDLVSTHSHPKAAASDGVSVVDVAVWFQHSAARRRLQLF